MIKILFKALYIYKALIGLLSHIKIIDALKFHNFVTNFNITKDNTSLSKNKLTKDK